MNKTNACLCHEALLASWSLVIWVVEGGLGVLPGQESPGITLGGGILSRLISQESGTSLRGVWPSGGLVTARMEMLKLGTYMTALISKLSLQGPALPEPAPV